MPGGAFSVRDNWDIPKSSELSENHGPVSCSAETSSGGVLDLALQFPSVIIGFGIRVNPLFGVVFEWFDSQTHPLRNLILNLTQGG